MQSQRLAGQRVVITGGTSGIGAATSRRFIAEGAHVVAFAAGRQEVSEASERVPGIRGAVLADVSRPDQVADAFAQADAMFAGCTGRTGIDVLINNAGISIRHRFLDIDPSTWERVIAVNLNGMFFCAQQAARRMVEADGGVILMTASTNGIVGHPQYADYNASKAGVILLVKSMALELAPLVRVNCVCPGYVLTPMQEAEYTPEMLRRTDQKIPLGRHAQPEEVASLFAFLASSEGAYINGAAIPIDAGETAGGLASRDWLLPSD